MHPWEGILDIPENHLGEWSVYHHKITEEIQFPLITENQRMLNTMPLEDPIVFKRPTTWHILKENNEVWMTDYPVCQNGIDHHLKSIKGGTVLVGGLGLGYAVTVLAWCQEIDRIVVVEKELDVINLIRPHLKTRGMPVEYVHDDLFAFLQQPEKMRDIDYTFYDVWKAEDADVFFSYIRPLVDLTLPYLDYGSIICWNEANCRQQMEMSLITIFTGMIENSPAPIPGLTIQDCITPTGNIHHDWAIPFFHGVKDGNITIDNLKEEAENYAFGYGRNI